MPFVLKLIAPSYYRASIAVKNLEGGSVLTTNDVGVREVGGLVIKSYLDGLTNALKGPIPSNFTNIFFSKIFISHQNYIVGIGSGSSVAGTIENLPTTPNYGFNSPIWSIVKQQVEELKGKNILIFCFALFFIGAIAEIVAFFLGSAEANKSNEVSQAHKGESGASNTPIE